MPSELHELLCEKSARWLKQHGFPVSAPNVWGAGSRERVDAIGFRQQCAVLIEVKVSRSDFLSDKRKPERSRGGVGTYRFYVAPEGLLSVSEMPNKWGLIEWNGRSLSMRHGPKGNLWPAFEKANIPGWTEFANEPCQKSERSLLYTIARKSLTT